MTWVRLDDDFGNHPKLREAGPLGIAMQVVALCYCNKYLTDGFIPRSVIPSLLNLEGLAMRCWEGELVGGGQNADWSLIVEDLIGAGLWHEVDGGYQIHDYLEYQPSRAQVLAERAANAKRQAEWQAKKKASSNRRHNATTNHTTNIVSDAVTNTITDTVTNSTPVPVNTLSTREAHKKRAPSRKPVRDDRTDHPAVQAVRSVTGRNPPRETYGDIIALVGDQPDVARMESVYKEWRAHGFSAVNLQGWLFDWYVKGVPKTNGHASDDEGESAAARLRKVMEARNGTDTDSL